MKRIVKWCWIFRLELKKSLFSPVDKGKCDPDAILALAGHKYQYTSTMLYILLLRLYQTKENSTGRLIYRGRMIKTTANAFEWWYGMVYDF